jgi:hypothetical protein
MGTAAGDAGRLPAHDTFAGEFACRPVSMIVAGSPPAALAARVATTSVPIVFVVGLDPVAAGLVASLNKPGGNATGMTLITGRRSICLRSTWASPSNDALLGQAPPWLTVIAEQSKTTGIAQAFSFHTLLVAPSQPDNLFRTMKLSNPSSATCHH